MIVVSAHMWPGGNAAAAYQLGTVTISNQDTTPDGSNYTAHVITRPKPDLGIFGVEADVEVRNHQRGEGFFPLLISVLAASVAHGDDSGMHIPPSRALARSLITDMDDFDKRLRGRQ